jgi:hypothetical protein
MIYSACLTHYEGEVILLYVTTCDITLMPAEWKMGYNGEYE